MVEAGSPPGRHAGDPDHGSDRDAAGGLASRGGPGPTDRDRGEGDREGYRGSDGARDQPTTKPAEPTEPPSITVAVVSYFSADPLAACLDSIVSQRGVDPRVVVVDNGVPESAASETETERICRAYEAVEYLESDANVGYGAAVNRAFAHGDTEYLVAINPDATFGEGSLRRLLDPLATAHADEGARPAFTAPKILLADDPDRISTCGLVNHVTGISFNQAADLPANHPNWVVERDLESLSGCAFATTAAAWNRVGGFDDEMFLYKDDVNLSWACACLGERIRFVPDAHVYHDYERGLDGFKLFHVERSRLLLLAKYFPRSAVLLAPSLVLAELLTWVMAGTLGLEGLRGKLGAYRALFDGSARSIRRGNESFREQFPDALEHLHAGLPWRTLRRTGIVPDSSVVSGAGLVLNVLFRVNVALYRSVLRLYRRVRDETA